VPSNRITSVTNNGVKSNYVYDAAGNLTNDGAHSYQYDAENRIVKLDAGTANEASYSYDANNWRVKKVAGAFTTYYIWEGAQVIAEYSNTPAGTGGTSYYLADRLSTRMITDGNGAFKGTQDHLPFGEEAGTTGTTEKHRFTNYERDGESGSDYAINRQHQCITGRFLQPDPIFGSAADPQSLNLYSYVANDPVNFLDPLGLKKICVPSQVPGDEGCVFCWDDKDDKGQVWKDCSAQFGGRSPVPAGGPGLSPIGAGAGGGGEGSLSLFRRGIGLFLGPCLKTSSRNWRVTNAYVFTKPGGTLLRVAAGVLTGGAIANQQGLVSFGQLARAVLSGARSITTGGVTYTLLEGAILTLPNAALNSVLVGAALEAGITVGSFLNEDCFRFTVPTTFIPRF
jgi:RHS repeat-associated protein